MVRHLYFPCIRRGFSKTAASVVVFFVSAVMHEIMFSVPLHMIRFHSFIGMMAQIPLSAVTKYLYKRLPGTSIGNIIFWVSFCLVGQPTAMLLYTFDYWQQQRYSGNVAIGQMTCNQTQGFPCDEL
jgi:diacylglycerol O-acyltransferase-1